MPADLRDLIDGTLLRRAVVPPEPGKPAPKRRTQSDRMRELRTMRAEMRERVKLNVKIMGSGSTTHEDANFAVPLSPASQC